MDEVNTEQVLRDEFSGRVKTTTIEGLPKLIAELMGREHDYGTICVAMGIAAATTAWAMNKHPQGGITGFQAGAAAWEMLRHWGALYPGECGGRMVDYDKLLYPQYADTFTSIPESSLELVRDKARKMLSEKGENVSPDVAAHWQSVADGVVPFGLSVAA